MSLFPSSSTRLVRDLLLRAPVLSHLASDKVRTSLRQRRISLGLNRHQVQGVGSSPVRELSPAPGNLHCPRKLSVPRRVQGLGSQIHWLSLSGANPIVAHGVGVHRITAPPNCLCL